MGTVSTVRCFSKLGGVGGTLVAFWLWLTAAWLVAAMVVKPPLPEEGLLTQLLQKVEKQTFSDANEEAKAQVVSVSLKNALKYLGLRNASIASQKNHQTFLKGYLQASSDLRAAITQLHLTSPEEEEEVGGTGTLAQQMQWVQQRLQLCILDMDTKYAANETLAKRIAELPDLLQQAKQLQQALEQRLSAMDVQEWASLSYEQDPEKFATEMQLAAEWAWRSEQLVELEKEMSYSSKRFALNYLELELLDLKRQRDNDRLDQLRKKSLLQQARSVKKWKLVNERSPAQQEAEKLLKELQQKDREQQQRLASVGDRKFAMMLANATVNNTIKQIQEQAQWLPFSASLGEAFRNRYKHLPVRPNLRELDAEIAARSAENLEWQALYQTKQTALQGDFSSAKEDLSLILQKQEGVLRKLVINSEQVVLGLTQLAGSSRDLINALDLAAIVFNQHLFWVPSTTPIGFQFPMEVAKELGSLVPSPAQGFLWLQAVQGLLLQISNASLVLLLGCFLVAAFVLGAEHQYIAFLGHSMARLGKVTQDHFGLTTKMILWGTWITTPIPFLMWAIGSVVRRTEFSSPATALVALGAGVMYASPVLWIGLLFRAFSDKGNLFLEHFRWPATMQLRCGVK